MKSRKLIPLLLVLFVEVARADSTVIFCELGNTTAGSPNLSVMDGSANSIPFTDRFRMEGRSGDFNYIVSMFDVPEFNVTLIDKATGLSVENMIEEDSLKSSLGSDLIQIAAIPSSGQYSGSSGELVVLSCGLRSQ
jgi:hypothetical protein